MINLPRLTLNYLLNLYHEAELDIVVTSVPFDKFSCSEATFMVSKKISSQTKTLTETDPPLIEPKPLPKLNAHSEIVQQAIFLANQAQSLKELRLALENFQGCPLKKTANHLVFGEGNSQARVMIVGEAPGADEDRLGRPFVGLSGQLLDRAFATIHLDRTKIYISNIVPWRPPGNRLPTAQEIAVCMPFIQRHIELISPEFLILAGGTSAKALLNTKEGIVKLRGKWQNYHSHGLQSPIQAMPIFHPAYLLRSPGQKKFVWLDLLNLNEKLMV